MSRMEQQINSRRSFWNNMGRSSEGLTGKDALKRFGLDWEPEIKSIRYDHRGSTLQSNDFKILVNNKTGKDLSTMSGTWQPLGNREFYNRANAAIEVLGGRIDRGGYLHGSKSSLRMGERCAFLLSEEVPALAYALFDDHVEAYVTRIMFYNHHSPGNGIGVKVISIRYVCVNGMVSKAFRNTLTASHTDTGIENYRQVEKVIESYRSLLAIQRQRLETLAGVTVTLEEAREHFIDLVGNSKKTSDDQPVGVGVMTALFNGDAAGVLEDQGIDLSINDYTDQTAYGVLQAVTAYHSHFRGGHKSPDTAIRSKVFNDSALNIQKAMDSLSRAYIPRHLINQQKQAQSVDITF